MIRNPHDGKCTATANTFFAEALRLTETSRTLAAAGNVEQAKQSLRDASILQRLGTLRQAGLPCHLFNVTWD